MHITKRMKIRLSLFLGIVLCSQSVYAEVPATFHNAISLQGFTGILNTPNAHVTREGDLYALYSNQKESKWRNRVPFQDNYFFNVGLFNFVEIGATLFEAPRVNRDLSASVKFSTEPFFNKYPYMPVLALGMQDISGGASFLKTKYAVLSEDLWRLRLSAGYGTGPDRMDGLFAGGEFKLHDWVYLLADYDTRESNAGIRAVLPHFWKVPVSFTATAKTSLNHQPGNFDVAVGFSLPLDFNVRKTESKPSVTVSHKQIDRSDSSSMPSEKTNVLPESVQKDKVSRVGGTNPGNTAPIGSAMEALATLRERLVKAGFLNVRVGDKHGRIVIVEYENSIFNHNELDALGVVAGATVELLKDEKIDTVRIIVKKKGINMLQIAAPFSALHMFLQNGNSVEEFRSKMEFSTVVDYESGTNFVAGDENSSFLTTSLVLWPGLSTIVGVAENGGAPFEYRLSLKPDLYINLWKGGMLNARWDVPLSWSHIMDDGKMDTIMERAMLFQGVRLLPDVIANLGAGMVMHDIYGTMNEINWQPWDGTHRVRIAQTWGNNSVTHKKLDSLLASYRYYFTPLDLSVEGYAGKFLSQDRGFSVEMKRFFGDAAFSVYYKNTTTSDSKHWQAGGIQFSFPLTPEKDMKPFYKLQVRGTDEWTYAQETTFKNSNALESKRRGELNYLPDVPLAVAPVLTGSLHNQYFNRDRLNEAYIKSHLERLRSSWIKYRSIVQ